VEVEIMVGKKSVQEWPPVVGDYIIGDVESAVAVVTLGSHMEDIPVNAGASISGPLHTENLGIEKVIANVVSNPNLRFLVVCGAEVQGHITGQSIKALHENGADPEKKRINGATGAIPYVENLNEEAIQRLQDQVEVIDMVNVEDPHQIQAQIKECLAQDSGAFEEESLVIQLPKKGAHPTENT